ncbi:MAG: hypothetical protein HYU55_00385 [Nocardioides sp.]|nr:hypothetical protein [Nocardioides sp.]
MASPQTGNREFRDDIVRVAALTVTEPIIAGYTFVNCRIVGPAVLAILHDVDIMHCTFEGDVNSLFWEVDPMTRPQVFGAVGVWDSKFVSCSFQGIGFAGTRELREMMEAETHGPD